jgi:hypothetical protein
MTPNRALAIAGAGLFAMSFGLTWWWLDRAMDGVA